MCHQCACGQYIDENKGDSVLVAFKLSDFESGEPVENCHIYFCKCGRVIIEKRTGLLYRLMRDPMHGDAVEYSDGTRLKEKTYSVRIEDAATIARDLYISEMSDVFDSDEASLHWAELNEDSRKKYYKQAECLLEKYQISRERPYLDEWIKQRDEGSATSSPFI